MDAKLVVVGGEAANAEYALTLPAIVGRSRSADLKLGHPLVSRRHCELSEKDGQLIVRDLGSLNGTFIGDARISDATALPPGGKVTIGGVTLQAIYGDMSRAQGNGGRSANALTGAIGGAAISVEQTVEMSDSGIVIPEQILAGAPSDGVDLAWLEDPSKQEVGSQEFDSIEDLSLPQPVTEELRFPDAGASPKPGEPEGSDEPPGWESKAAKRNDDDLTDFFESLK